MIPRVADIDIDVDVRAEDLASLSVADVAGGLRAIHGCVPCFYCEGSSEHAPATLAPESVALNEVAAQAMTRARLMSVPTRLVATTTRAWRSASPRRSQHFARLAVRHFGASGGHGDMERSRFPYVILGADLARVTPVCEAATGAGCGLGFDAGLVVARAPSPTEMLRLASELTDRRGRFDALPMSVVRPTGDLEDEW